MARPTLELIQAPIAAELDEFEIHFRTALTTKVMLLDQIMRFIVRRKGKQMRPMFVLLAANLSGGIQPATYRGAALIELLHTATLIHDDVVDDSDERRGFFSINALWKNKIAVLIGDYLLSRGLLMSLESKDYNLLHITSEAVRLMSEGELLQIQKARTLNIDEPVYFEIIRQKTASLIAACCACGAASANASPEVQERMRLFGEKVGLAFQIKDDLFDFGGSDAGKPTGIDIKEKKMTLPLIHTLNKASWNERRKLINIVKRYSTNPDKVAWLMNYVRESGGISYSEQRMQEYVNEALELLDSFPPSPSRESMRNLVLYTVQRAS
jgi:octaprenyl-diphosphate synthase